jgi:hypothetical protein
MQNKVLMLENVEKNRGKLALLRIRDVYSGSENCFSPDPGSEIVACC